MAHGRIWPAHPKPLPDELLSSWMVRIAQANAIKLQSLCWIVFGNSQSPWNRDIDRSAPEWLIKALSLKTGTPYRKVLDTTLLTYKGRLYRKPRYSGPLSWISVIQSHGMKHKGFGQQFCPVCLETDPVPYFRKQWRLALFTYCPEHQIYLHDACPQCQGPIMHYRGDFGREIHEALPIYCCPLCEMDLRQAPQIQPNFANSNLHVLFDACLNSLYASASQATPFRLDYFLVLHHLSWLMVSKPNKGKLAKYLAAQIDRPSISHDSKRIAFEQLRRPLRHHYLQLALWLMENLPSRLEAAWLNKTVQYNLMLKDFEHPPDWYRKLTGRFSDWRHFELSARILPPC